MYVCGSIYSAVSCLYSCVVFLSIDCYGTYLDMYVHPVHLTAVITNHNCSIQSV